MLMKVHYTFIVINSSIFIAKFVMMNQITFKRLTSVFKILNLITLFKFFFYYLDIDIDNKKCVFSLMEYKKKKRNETRCNLIRNRYKCHVKEAERALPNVQGSLDLYFKTEL